MTNVQAVLDAPAFLFVDDLVAAYLEAEVVLTNRNVDKWMYSMHATLLHVFQWPLWRILQYTDLVVTRIWYRDIFWTWKAFCDNDYNETCRQRLIDYYEHVRNVVPKERSLEFEPKDGYRPLCVFLDLETLDDDFPNVNGSSDFTSMHTYLWRGAVKRIIVNVVSIAVPLLTLGIYTAYRFKEIPRGVLDMFVAK